MPDLYVCGFTRVAYCWDMLRFESRVTPRFLTDDTNGTSASPMWMIDGKGLWTDILFESMIMDSVLLSFSWSLLSFSWSLFYSRNTWSCNHCRLVDLCTSIVRCSVLTPPKVSCFLVNIDNHRNPGFSGCKPASCWTGCGVGIFDWNYQWWIFYFSTILASWTTFDGKHRYVMKEIHFSCIFLPAITQPGPGVQLVLSKINKN